MKYNLIALTSAAILVSSTAQAASVVFHTVIGRYPTPAESGAAVEPVPAGSQILRFYLTSDADILSIGLVDARTGGPLFNHSLGTNHSRPSW
jgi:hypothetical protein